MLFIVPSLNKRHVVQRLTVTVLDYCGRENSTDNFWSILQAPFENHLRSVNGNHRSIISDVNDHSRRYNVNWSVILRIHCKCVPPTNFPNLFLSAVVVCIHHFLSLLLLLQSLFHLKYQKHLSVLATDWCSNDS